MFVQIHYLPYSRLTSTYISGASRPRRRPADVQTSSERHKHTRREEVKGEEMQIFMRLRTELCFRLSFSSLPLFSCKTNPAY